VSTKPAAGHWDYPGISSLGSKRGEELAMHPTVKPVALVADAIKDCSRRGETVLDVFGGSGTTLVAAESCGRQARLLEFDAAYCDTIIRHAPANDERRSPGSVERESDEWLRIKSPPTSAPHR
jgi:DNA modification methylase